MSTHGITGKRRRPKICPHPTGRLLSFRFLTNHSPRSSFQRYGLYPRSASYLGVPFIPASSDESKGRPFPHGRSSGQFHYVHPADDRTSMSEKNSWIHGAFEWGRRMRAKVIAADNCAFLALNGDSYISIL